MPQVNLLGKTLPVQTMPGADSAFAEVFPVIQGAVDVLNAQFGRNQLNETAIDYIRALNGLGVALERSFTPCAGTADFSSYQYVFFIGDEDVKVNADPLWYASTIIHDGGHARLSQLGQTAVGVAVEQALTQVQIDYYNSVGGRADVYCKLASLYEQSSSN
jgi:hypothetical protein